MVMMFGVLLEILVVIYDGVESGEGVKFLVFSL